MSYDLALRDKNGDTFSTDDLHTGGTMPIGGYTRTDFNITYNYSWFYYHCIDKEKGIRWLYGKNGGNTIRRLEKAINELGNKPYFNYPANLPIDDWTEENRVYNYWLPTPGNAGAALVPLLAAAKAHPEGIWEGD